MHKGVPAQSFIHAFTLTHSAFSVQLASPEGRPIDFANQDEGSKRWLNEFRTKPFSTPIKLDTVVASRYSALLVVDCPGALYDLALNTQLAQILQHFIIEKKPICAVGQGVSAFCGVQTLENINKWALAGYCLTGPSVCELARTPGFASLPIVIEDYVKDNGANYSGSVPDGVHVVVDRNIITGQNEASTLTAVQNLILLCNARQGKALTK
ncbi:glutamine amidotransferase-like class 1 domain-containing protein 1 [Amphiura filiformis]|uniref:glutamine amidotransferase-like class 1 domain-containing protein 1 n=1 Tax=Amphiura filiformis TaxID=82378 RepID=UPI003B217C85